MPPRIFISHSSDDVELVNRFVKVLEAALPLGGSDIRCTSLPGYGLESGAPISTTLRNEILKSEVILGVISQRARHSDWVLFELGAAWGLSKQVIPILCGVGHEALPASLKEQNAVNASKDYDILQLLETLQKALGLSPRPSPRYAEEVTRLVQVATQQSSVESEELSKDESALRSSSSTAEMPRQEIRNSLGIEFVLIPAGEFEMGSNKYEREQPVHTARISQPFYLGKYPVTQAQWEAVMGNDPSRFKDDPNRPVEMVSWEDVQGFIQRLNEKEGVFHYRLPTEAEWEYAARAGSTTAYSFGDDSSQLGEYAWYWGNAEKTTHSVGQLEPNAWGLYDMHGNVWEWIHDWYGEYPTEAVTDPSGPSSGSYRVLRGGGWLDGAGRCRSASRLNGTPGDRSYDLGFRLLRTAS